MDFTTINYYKSTQIITYLLNKPSFDKLFVIVKEETDNAKKVRKSFKQLLIENKQSLLSNKENMKEIEERIEKRHVSYNGANN